MKAATVKEIKTELNFRSKSELLELCMQLAKFKKENKELLTYLLYEAADEATFIKNIKDEIDQDFELINRKTYYFIKKSVRKILRNVKKYIRYSKKKETEVELLLYFCAELKNMSPSIYKNVTLTNLLNRQILVIRKAVSSMHEDLQFDYGIEINALLDNEE
jgi:hypothetical protein